MGNTVRVTSPSRSRLRSVKVSIRCEMLPSARRISLNRFGPPPVPMQGGFFRSDDAGASWTRVASDTALWGRGWYFEKIAVDPRDADVVYVPNVAVNRSLDGGHSWDVPRGSPGGDDYHQMWVSPDDTNTVIVASDQGCIITHNARTKDPADVT